MTPNTVLEPKVLEITNVQYFQAKLAFEMTPWSLKALLEKNADSICLLDVRTPEMYATAHLPTAINIPLVDLVVQEPPADPAVFIHRCGRAGRAGRKGLAVTLLTPGSEENTQSSPVSSCHSGRRPRASTENTHSSAKREMSATGPWLKGPKAWRRYM